MSDNSSLVFLYGNHRKHEGNHRLLSGAELVAEQCRTAGRLYDTGSGYPIMAPSGTSSVAGELYRVDSEALRRLDVWEGCDYREGTEARSLRTMQPVRTDLGEKLAYVYWHPGALNGKLEPIEPGDWKYSRREKTDMPILYFAYGSCMDDARFKQAGVASLFLDVLGKGALHGYSLRFTRKARDGGRADMLEIGGTVEGKVYRIGPEALEYLKRREGMNSGAYRPAFVDIRVGRRTIKDALTFLAAKKATSETLPPAGYLAEIRRGGREVWSEEYRDRFELHLETLAHGFAARQID